MQSVQRYIFFSYLAITLLVWAVLSRLLNSIAYYLNISDPTLIGTHFPVTAVMALFLAGGAFAYAWKNEVARTYTSEVVVELTKVTWPSRKETQRSTVVVIVACLVLAGIIGVVDFIWGQLTGLIYT